MSRSVFLEWEMFQKNVLRKIKTHFGFDVFLTVHHSTDLKGAV